MTNLPTPPPECENKYDELLLLSEMVTKLEKLQEHMNSVYHNRPSNSTDEIFRRSFGVVLKQTEVAMNLLGQRMAGLIEEVGNPKPVYFVCQDCRFEGNKEEAKAHILIEKSHSVMTVSKDN